MDKYVFGKFPSAINLVTILEELDNKEVSHQICRLVDSFKRTMTTFMNSYRVAFNLEAQGQAQILADHLLKDYLKRLDDIHYKFYNKFSLIQNLHIEESIWITEKMDRIREHTTTTLTTIKREVVRNMTVPARARRLNLM
jgi:hypothetical protein